MSDNWQKVFSSSQLQQVEMLKALLLEHEINSIVVNKQDSLYTVLGEIQLFVNRDDLLNAIQIIKKATNE